MGMETGMGMVDRKWEGNGNSSLEEIPVSRVNHGFGIIFFHAFQQRLPQSKDFSVLQAECWRSGEQACRLAR